MATTQRHQKPRVIVTTDISSLESGFKEPDDTQSLVRFLLYACDIDIEGLVATRTSWPEVRTDYIAEIVRRYSEVYPSLVRHNPGYPPADTLMRKIKAGTVRNGIANLGTDTEGSDWIIQVADQDDPRPLWIIVWGGPHELAQALWRVRADRSPEDLAAFVRKLRVYAIADQDDTGPWIKATFPDLFYITSGVRRAFRGIYKGGDRSLVSSAWVQAHLKGHGPLGDGYVDYNGGGCVPRRPCQGHQRRRYA